MTRHFTDISAIAAADVRTILDEAHRRKQSRAGAPKGMADHDAPLAGHTLAMIFEKSSTRTRVSFEQAMRQLGGSTIVLQASDMQLGRGELISDTAKVLSRFVDAIMIRTDAHAKCTELAQVGSVPVINGLTDRSHPCQLLADVMTYEEQRGSVAGTTWAWLGDGNNVCHSLLEIAAALHFNVRCAVPDGFEPDANIVAAARAGGAQIEILRDANAAVRDADVVVTDTWVSMGQDHAAEKLHAMMPYQVTQGVMAAAKPEALFLHCLPAHRGEEVLAKVIDGPQSAVWDEAENRLHAQKAVLLWCLEKID